VRLLCAAADFAGVAFATVFVAFATRPSLALTFEGLAVRVIMVDGVPWWVLADVCAVLEHSNPSMLGKSLDADERDDLSIVDPIGRQQQTTVISEPGLYKLLMTSRKPQAKRFDRWVRHEVLPEEQKRSISEQKRSNAIIRLAWRGVATGGGLVKTRQVPLAAARTGSRANGRVFGFWVTFRLVERRSGRVARRWPVERFVDPRAHVQWGPSAKRCHVGPVAMNSTSPSLRCAPISPRPKSSTASRVLMLII
jgi:hypothetical protein